LSSIIDIRVVIFPFFNHVNKKPTSYFIKTNWGETMSKKIF